MNKKKMGLAALLVLLAVGIALTWLLSTYYIVDTKLYRKDTQALDLRGQTVSVSHYEKLKERLPEAEIRWDVPFQGNLLADDTGEVTVTELSAEDARILAGHLPKLQTVSAEDCSDYENLLWLKQQRPEVRVEYQVPLDGKKYAGTAADVILSSVTEEDIQGLDYLPDLEEVTVTGGEPELLRRLQAYCAARELALGIRIGGEDISEKAVIAEIEGITNEEVNLLHLLTKLKKLHLVEPEADAETVIALADALSETVVTWEKSILGLTFQSDAAEIDLTDAVSLGEGQKPGDKTGYQYGLDFPVQGTQEEIPTAIKMSKYHPVADRTDDTKALIAEVEAAMDYFPNAERVLMIGGLLHNVLMSNFREEHREDYKVVWSVQCGNVLTRSDATFFMPVKYHVYYLTDSEAYNLRYLEEAVAVDIGHMAVSDISFVKYMPNLEYLILAHTKITYIEPIRSCKNLKFLEVDWTGIRDLSPLIDCTALEDLNVGNTSVDLSPLKEMTWLKNLWAIFRGGSVYPISQALTNTKVVASGNATVASGWRDLPNYYAMRDELKMYYMSW